MRQRLFFRCDKVVALSKQLLSVFPALVMESVDAFQSVKLPKLDHIHRVFGQNETLIVEYVVVNDVRQAYSIDKVINLP